jgi:hypothetical protein
MEAAASEEERLGKHKAECWAGAYATLIWRTPMRKKLSLDNMSHKYGAGFLVSAYFVLGIALVPMQSLVPSTLPSFQNVFFAECHWGCTYLPGGKCRRTYICSSQGKTGPGGSTGPAKASKGPTGSTGPFKPVPPQTNKAYR